MIRRLPPSLMVSVRAVPLLGGGQVLLGEQDELVLLVLVVVVRAALLGELPRRVEEEQAEDVEHPAEVVDRRGADHDEDRAHDQGQHDADHQRGLLVLTRHRELRHDDDEDEQVVDGEAVLRQPAGEELRPGVRRQRVRLGEEPQREAEDHGQADVQAQLEADLLHRGLVGATADDQQVDEQDPDGDHDGDRPDEGEATESPMMAFKELAPPEWRALPAHVRAYASRTGTPEVSSAHPVAR